MSTNTNKKLNDISKQALKHLKTVVAKAKQLEIGLIVGAIIVLLITLIIWYIVHITRLNQANCDNLKSIYTSTPRLTSVVNTNNKTFLLRDFYVKTAYNCCSAGEFRNDFVNLCALTTCIQQGVRCLDFEIYSIDNVPVVATSSINDFTVKETFNSIPMAQVFNIINNLAFSSGACPNSSDPLILNFRIMSNNVKMYDALAQLIRTELSGKILNTKFSNEFNGNNLGQVPILTFKEKIIIIVDGQNPLYKSTALDEFVNIASGTPFLHLLKYQEVKFTQDVNLTEFNKKNMSIVIPDWTADDTNQNFNIVKQYGCQFVGMSFQNYDTNLEHYNAFFDGHRTAFALKPANLRFVPVTIPTPAPPPPEYSYKTRPITSDFYNYKI